MTHFPRKNQFHSLYYTGRRLVTKDKGFVNNSENNKGLLNLEENCLIHYRNVSFLS